MNKRKWQNTGDKINKLNSIECIHVVGSYDERIAHNSSSSYLFGGAGDDNIFV